MRLELEGVGLKRAEITYGVRGGFAKIIGYKNILTFKEIINLLGEEKAQEYYRNGAFFYRVPEASHMPEYVRIGTDERNNILVFSGVHLYLRDLKVMLNTMRDAGNRFSKLLRDEIITVKI